MNRLYSLIKKLSVMLTVCGLFVTCSKMEDSHKDFLKGGEKIYAVKVDSLITRAGNKRIMLSGLLPAGAKIDKFRAYWHNGADSIEVKVTSTDGVDTVRVIINNLAEGSYNFDVYSYDQYGNVSTKTAITGRVYGNIYQEALVNRMIRSTAFTGGKLTINWYPSDAQVVRSELNYTDAAGVSKKVTVKASDDVTELNGFKNGSSVVYRTLYLPEPLAIDSFYTGEISEAIMPVETELNPALFVPYILPGDAKPQTASHSLSRLWNGNLGAGGDYRTNNSSTMPHHYNWSLGVSAKLTRLVVFQRGANAEPALLYTLGNPKYFEVWGSNDPAPDGSDAGWIKLLDGESIKPSGPGTEVTEDDRAYAKPGEVYHFPANSPPVKYIRIRFIQTWGNTLYSFLNEVDVWGIPQ